MAKDSDTLIIEEGTTYIPNSAYSKGTFKRVILPSTLKVIGENAFFKCKKLKEIKIPPSLEIIHSHAFCRCESLEKIDIKNVSFLHRSVFESCNLKSIKMDNVEYIDVFCFENTRLEHINLPASLRFLDSSALADMPYLKSINVNKANKRYVVQNNNLIDKQTSMLVLGLNTTLPNVSVIGDCAFSNLRTEVLSIPFSVKYLDGEPFYGCKCKVIILPPSLEGISFNSLNELDDDIEVHFLGTKEKFITLNEDASYFTDRVKFIEKISLDELIKQGYDLKQINKMQLDKCIKIEESR